MTYYSIGMPPELQRADIEHDSLRRRFRTPTALTVHLGNALQYAKQYFDALQTSQKAHYEIINHLGRCDTCRTSGWEHCWVAKDIMSGGKTHTTISIQ